MAKKKTFGKRVRSSKKMDPIKVTPEIFRKLKEKFPPHDPIKKISDPSFVAKALVDCLFEGDERSFKEILKWHYEAVNITKGLEKAKLSQRTFYNALSPKGNPSLKTVFKILKGLAA